MTEMTPLEELLKKILDQRPDIKKKIPDADGLVSYIAWMDEHYGGRYQGKDLMEDMTGPSEGSGAGRIADYIKEHSVDEQARALLFSGFDRQSEKFSIQTDYDITLNRMLRYFPGQWHTSEYFEVYYAPEGTCPIHFEQEVINISRGAILIVAPGIVHASPCYADDAILYSFMIRSTTFEQVFLKQLPKISLLASFFKRALSSESRNAWLYFDTAEDPDLMDMCGKMYQLSHQPGIYNSQLMNALMTVFLITVLKKYESTARLPRTGNFFWKHEYSAILSYIQQNYAHAGIADVAEHFHYSTRQVSRVIKESLNLTYAQLIRKLRMEQAADMLLQEKYSVETIGSTVGYADTSSFCRAFAAYYKMTPGEYAESQFHETRGQTPCLAHDS